LVTVDSRGAAGWLKGFKELDSAIFTAGAELAVLAKGSIEILLAVTSLKPLTLLPARLVDGSVTISSGPAAWLGISATTGKKQARLTDHNNRFILEYSLF
jgi:hypothetical protein